MLPVQDPPPAYTAQNYTIASNHPTSPPEAHSLGPGPNVDALLSSQGALRQDIYSGIALSLALHGFVYAPPIDCDSHYSPSTSPGTLGSCHAFGYPV
jgi:hypothetical protein